MKFCQEQCVYESVKTQVVKIIEDCPEEQWDLLSSQQSDKQVLSQYQEIYEIP